MLGCVWENCARGQLCLRDKNCTKFAVLFLITTIQGARCSRRPRRSTSLTHVRLQCLSQSHIGPFLLLCFKSFSSFFSVDFNQADKVQNLQHLTYTSSFFFHLPCIFLFFFHHSFGFFSSSSYIYSPVRQANAVRKVGVVFLGTFPPPPPPNSMFPKLGVFCRWPVKREL